MQNEGLTPSEVSQTDQAMAQLRAVGQMYAALYKSLIESDLPEDAACAITCAHTTKNKA